MDDLHGLLVHRVILPSKPVILKQDEREIIFIENLNRKHFGGGSGSHFTSVRSENGTEGLKEHPKSVKWDFDAKDHLNVNLVGVQWYNGVQYFRIVRTCLEALIRRLQLPDLVVSFS